MVFSQVATWTARCSQVATRTQGGHGQLATWLEQVLLASATSVKLHAQLLRLLVGCLTATAEYRHRGSGSGTGTGRMANESMSAIENVDGLDDGMELLPPPETAPAPASADEKLHAMQPGISVEQFAEWRGQFDGWVAEYESRKLLSAAKLKEIHDLLSSWDTMTVRERKDASPSAYHWMAKYEAMADGVVSLRDGGKLCLPREQMFDYLLPEHFAGNHVSSHPQSA